MNNNLTQFLRKDLQEKLEAGKVNSIIVQTVALIHFAQQLGYEPVNGDVRKGFKGYVELYNQYTFKSLHDMQQWYNLGIGHFMGLKDLKEWYSMKIVSRISLQYNKRTSKQLTSELHWLKFIKEK